MTKVELWKKVDYKTLENALVKSAEELGWKVKIKENFREKYQLGSVKETKEYEDTQFNIKGSFFPVMKVIVDKNRLKLFDSFYIWTGLPFGVALKTEVKKYLNAVSSNL